MGIQERNIEAIKKKLGARLNIDSIEKIKTFPRKLNYIDWTFGTLEVFHYYKIMNLAGRTIYCYVGVLFRYFILKIRFFEEVNGKYKRW